jgi:hypothetical protein
MILTSISRLTLSGGKEFWQVGQALDRIRELRKSCSVVLI